VPGGAGVGVHRCRCAGGRHARQRAELPQLSIELVAAVAISIEPFAALAVLSDAAVDRSAAVVALAVLSRIVLYAVLSRIALYAVLSWIILYAVLSGIVVLLVFILLVVVLLFDSFPLPVVADVAVAVVVAILSAGCAAGAAARGRAGASRFIAKFPRIAHRALHEPGSVGSS
jgi:hypothetical protein